MTKIKLAESEEILYKCRGSVRNWGFMFFCYIGMVFSVSALFLKNPIMFVLFFGFFVIIIAFPIFIFASVNSLLTRTTITSIRIIQIKRKKIFTKKIVKEIKITDILFIGNYTHSLTIAPQSEDIQDMANLMSPSDYHKYTREISCIYIGGKDNTYKIIEILKKVILLTPHPVYDSLLLNRQINGDFSFF